MADVTLTYKGATIAEMSNTGSKTLKTSGKYCEGDIGVSYFKPASGSVSGWDESTVKSLIERSSILNLTLPSDLTKIGKGAFYGCQYLKNITLPNTVTRIEDFAFTGCYDLILNSIPSNVEYIGKGAFSGCSNINFTKLPNGLTTIYRDAFNMCTKLALTSIPSVHSIEESAFYSCNSLNINTISAKYIKNSAFAYCNSLTEITINGKTSVYDYAFRECANLTKVTFKSSDVSMSTRAFYGCTNLTNIYVPWAEGAVSGAPWGATNATIHYNTTT